MDPKSCVFLHPDGYVEMVFIGFQGAEQLETLAYQAKALIEEHGPTNVLIDGRFGRIELDIANFSMLLRLGRIPRLKKLIVLTSSNFNDPVAIHGPGLVASILSTALGLRPVYISDESLARAKAENKTANIGVG